jgi:hypothetical protein
MLKIGVVSLYLSFALVISAFLGVYYQIIPTDPTRVIVGLFVICVTIGTLPIWLPWLRGTHG